MTDADNLGLDHDYPKEMFANGVPSGTLSLFRGSGGPPIDVTIPCPTHGDNTPITCVVIHRMEAPMRSGTAVAVARYFAAGAGGRGVAAHYSVDPTTSVQSAPATALLYHAPPNHGAVGIEQAGYCADNNWRTADGEAMMKRTAAIARYECDAHGLPLVWLSAADLRAGKKGITSHSNRSAAFGQSTHTDPDPHFPVDYFMSLVNGGGGGTTQPPPPPPAADAVPPQINPPDVLVPIVDVCVNDNGQGFYQLGIDGSLYNWCGAPFIRGANGMPWFSGRRAATLTSEGNGKVKITAHTGETYHLPLT